MGDQPDEAFSHNSQPPLNPIYEYPASNTGQQNIDTYKQKKEDENKELGKLSSKDFENSNIKSGLNTYENYEQGGFININNKINNIPNYKNINSSNNFRLNSFMENCEQYENSNNINNINNINNKNNNNNINIINNDNNYNNNNNINIPPNLINQNNNNTFNNPNNNEEEDDYALFEEGQKHNQSKTKENNDEKKEREDLDDVSLDEKSDNEKNFNDLLLAQYIKVKRVKSKWKVSFKDCVLQNEGKEFVLGSIHGDLDRDW